MKALQGLVLTIVLGISAVAAAATDVQSFQAWKNARVDEAKTSLEQLQSEKGIASEPSTKTTRKVENSKPTARLQPSVKAAKSDQKLQQAQINLEIAQEFTVNDYFILYLSQLKTRDAFVEVARKLTPEETAELMLAYQRSLSGAAQADLPPTAMGPSPSSKPIAKPF